MRQRLAAAPPRAGVAAELSGMEAAAYALLARRRSEALPIMMLKDSLLLRPPLDMRIKAMFDAEEAAKREKAERFGSRGKKESSVSVFD